ncbi:DUF932 domain-containing protein [Streptomyces sp. TR02-1]|uniref:DUF932 domain-containing protein n=1 Tax=Streptomyces sp. TR02-1 TaxID=3385977 RepID=UPI0039A252CF
MFSYRETPWHGEGQVIDHMPESWAEIRRLGGFEWDIESEPVFALHGVNDDGSARYKAIPGYKRIYRDDTAETLAVHNASWEGISHAAMGEVAEAILGQDGILGETGGVLAGGAKVWALFRLGDPWMTKGDISETYPYLALLNAHDGSSAFQAIPTAVRVVCHAEGTPIQDQHWRGPVEQHPSATEPRVGPGLSVSVQGLPFPEKVTTEHRYWARQRRRRTSALGSKRPIVGRNVEPGWVEAKDLVPGAHELGMPIDTTEVQAPPIETVSYSGSGPGFRKLWAVQRDPRLDAPEWWWLIGYWLGDGNIHLNHRSGEPAGVTVAVADGDTATLERVISLYRSAGWTGSPTKRQGCVQATLYDETLANLLDGWVHHSTDERVKGRGKKVPPQWVEYLPLPCQRELIKGLNDADGNTDTTEGAIIANTSLDLLLSARRILMRLGIPSSLQNSSVERTASLQGREVHCQASYTLRFWHNTEHLGIKHRFTGRFVHPYIEDGWMWCRVSDVDQVEEGRFWPITTASSDYVSAFGRSHNCQNTWHLSEMNAKTQGVGFSIRHTRNWRDQMEAAREAVLGAREQTQEVRQLHEQLSGLQITHEQEEEFVQRFIPIDPAQVHGKIAHRNALRARDNLRLIIAGPTCQGIQGTAEGLVQAAGEYLDHVRGYQTRDTYVRRTLLTSESLKAGAVELARKIALAA